MSLVEYYITVVFQGSLVVSITGRDTEEEEPQPGEVDYHVAVQVVSEDEHAQRKRDQGHVQDLAEKTNLDTITAIFKNFMKRTF